MESWQATGKNQEIKFWASTRIEQLKAPDSGVQNADLSVIQAPVADADKFYKPCLITKLKSLCSAFELQFMHNVTDPMLIRWLCRYFCCSKLNLQQISFHAILI